MPSRFVAWLTGERIRPNCRVGSPKPTPGEPVFGGRLVGLLAVKWHVAVRDCRDLPPLAQRPAQVFLHSPQAR
jgi:acyl-CoA thioesterase